MLALIGAMDQEVSGLLARMSATEVDTRGSLVVHRGTLAGRNLLLARSGVGRQAAERACGTILDQYPVTAIVSFGYCGALNPRLAVGDVVTCSRVFSVEGHSHQEPRCDAALLALMRAANRASSGPGNGVTCSRLVASIEDKRALFELCGADVVDMESYWVGAIAAENGIPFASVRVVSDSASDSLPELPTWRWRHVLPHFAIHPARGVTLYRGLRKASKNMTDFLSSVVEVVA